MPSRPPETQFYQETANYQLWRDISRLHEEFAGPDESQWPERRRAFERVLTDVSGKLRALGGSAAGAAFQQVKQDFESSKILGSGTSATVDADALDILISDYEADIKRAAAALRESERVAGEAKAICLSPA